MRSCRYVWTLMMVLLVCSTSATAAEKKEFIAAIDPDGIQRVDVRAGSYFFTPDYIVVKVNVPVEMKITMESGILPHDIVLQAPDAGMDIKMDLSKTPQVLHFTPTKTGSYPFSCDKKFLFFESHKEKGMAGTLEVRE
jgi:plastocyanin domain-containing protein